MIFSPKRTRRTWSGKTIQALHLRRVGSNHTKPWCKGNYGRCMTNGGRRKLKKFRASLTPTTPSSSLTPLRRCFVLQNLALVRCSLQTEPRSSRTRLLSEKDGKNTSVSYWTVHPQWTLLYLVRSPREQSFKNLTTVLPHIKSEMPSSRSPMARHLEGLEFLQKYSKPSAMRLYRHSMEYSLASGKWK